MKPTHYRSIGIIVSAHGMRGEVAVKPWDEDADWADTLKQVYVYRPKGPVEMEIQQARRQGGLVIVKFEGVLSREEAELLKGSDLKAPESALPALGTDEFYVDELVGFIVKSEQSGVQLGVLNEVLSSDAGDFLEVTAENLPEPVLVPFQDVFVPTIDREHKTIFVTGLDSLFQET